MNDVDDILKEAGTGLNDLLRQPKVAPTGEDVYRNTQNARLANFDALISTLRGPAQPREAAPPEVVPSAPFPKPPAGGAGGAGGAPNRLGIVPPTLPPIPAFDSSSGNQLAPPDEPPLTVKRLERPR